MIMILITTNQTIDKMAIDKRQYIMLTKYTNNQIRQTISRQIHANIIIIYLFLTKIK